MRRTPFLLAGLVLLTACKTPMRQDNQTPHTLKKRISRDVKLGYLAFVPKDYETEKRKRFPLMLFLHGAGERGTNIWLVAKHGPPKIVKTNAEFPFVLISPQCPAGERWSNDSLLALLDHVTERYRVDTNRIYVTGLSMGGYGTWVLATAHPARFAAIAPVCGGGETIPILISQGKHREALKTLPVWAFHGAKDPVVPLEESERMTNALQRVGNSNVKLTVYPEATHDSWTETYNNPKLYEWLLSHQLPRRGATAKP